MNKLNAVLARSLFVAALFAAPSFAADDEALKKIKIELPKEKTPPPTIQ